MNGCAKLIGALEECGEAAAIYKGQNIICANNLFAALFERTTDEMADLPFRELCHEESLEMIRDFMHRRAMDDHSVPTSYDCPFRTPDNAKIDLKIIAFKLLGCGGEVLVIARKK